MTIIEISVAVVALTFLGLGFYLFFVLKELRETLNRANKILYTLEPHINTLAEEACQLTKTTRNLALDLEHAVNPIFNSISNLAEGFEHRTTFYKKKCELKHMLREEEPETFESESQINKIVDLIELGVIFWQTFKKKRS